MIESETVSINEIEKYKRRLAREKMARQQAEDLLEQKAADLFEKNRELLSLSDGLEKLVAQRTAQMQNARDDALSALRVKSDFIANMSHELRTPMNGVLGILSILLDEDPSESQRELLKIAQSSGEHLLMVINDVLDFSKIEADKIELVMAPVNMRSYISGLCQPFELQSKQKGIQFEYHIEDDVPNGLITDKLRLTQILTNFLSNAVKFTQKGSVSLHIGHLGPVSDNKFRFTVSDTGIGISEQNIKSVFSAFEQADTSITREFGGTGLGMNISKRLIDLFDGEVHLESQYGQGTTFYVDITFDVADTLAEQSAVEAQLATTNAIEGNASVLLVEDNKINQLVAKRMLENWGLGVSIAENGQECLEMLAKTTYDLVLMDLQMPIKGGIEATTEARSLGLIADATPIIAMTAHSSQQHIDECFEAGMQGHVSKPIDKDALKALLETFLKPLSQQHEVTDPIDNIHIDGVNVKEGLKRLNGDWTLLHTLIASFLSEHLTLGEQIQSFIANNNKDEAIALLHRVKGSGGNLGIHQLATYAGEGETKLKNGDTLSDSEIVALQSAFNIVKSSFDHIDSPSKVQGNTELRTESPQYLLEKMDEILLNLSKDVLASEEALDDLLQCLTSEATQKLLVEANDAMQQFDTLQVENCINSAKLTVQEI